jgi:hypothetical protein
LSFEESVFWDGFRSRLPLSFSRFFFWMKRGLRAVIFTGILPESRGAIMLQ